MPIHSIAFLSNTITKPLERFLDGFHTVHYPLGTVIETLYTKINEDLLIIILDGLFFSDKTQYTLFKNALLNFRSHNTTKLIINTIYNPSFDIYAPMTAENHFALAQLNTDLCFLQKEITDLAILDFFGLCTQYGAKHLINERNRYLFQTPFTKKGAELICTEIRTLIKLFVTPRIKVIAVDADNTLWGGIVGEDGIDGIKIDNNYPGIIYKQFQQYLVELKQSGIILILLSKNDENAIDEVFFNKQMPLSPDDFVARSVNWNSKAENLDRILDQLNLTKTGVIFLDDSHAEIEEMNSRLGIPCYKMDPSNPLQNIETLKDITALKALRISEEDLIKTALYNDEKKRNAHSSTISSKLDFITSLEIKINVACNNHSHLERITQLTNKTNQFNLTTKRYELSQIKQLMETSHVYDFSVKDKFGEMGLVGVIIITEGEIDTFLMSCRVLGRGIEESILNVITRKHPDLKATYCKTSKNTLVEEFYEKNGFQLLQSNGNCKTYKFNKFTDIYTSIEVIDEH